MLEQGPASDWHAKSTTLCQILENACFSSPNSPFCSQNGATITYADALRGIDKLSKEVADASRGGIVALCLENSLSFLITYHAVLRAGCKPALLNAIMPTEGVAKLIQALGPDLVFARCEIPGVQTRTVTDEEILAFCGSGANGYISPAGATHDDIGAIFYSGGTTGHPKRISHSHRALMAKVERMEWGWPTNRYETWLPVAPFTHIYGYLMGVANPIFRAGHIVIPPRFKPEVVVDLMASERVTVFGGGPPAIYQALMAAENFATADLSALRVCPGGGAPFPIALHDRWRAATGLNIYEGLGMTEIAPIAVNTDAEGLRPGSAGKPCPDTVVEIVDLETGKRVLAPGEAGEIRVKGPHMMTGYDDAPEETVATMRDGFIYTGDIGVLDEDGFLTITDRKKDVIFHKGFNVFPREIEEALMTHDHVRQVCVVGRADERAGEVAIAFVSGDASVAAEALIDHCKQHLAAYKVPSEVRIEAELPLTPAGKLDRMQLRARVEA